jgi:hypothetical protein
LSVLLSACSGANKQDKEITDLVNKYFIYWAAGDEIGMKSLLTADGELLAIGHKDGDYAKVSKVEDETPEGKMTGFLAEEHPPGRYALYVVTLEMSPASGAKSAKIPLWIEFMRETESSPYGYGACFLTPEPLEFDT